MTTSVPAGGYTPPAFTTPAGIAEHLRDPAVLAALDGLLGRVERLNHAIDAISATTERAPVAIAAVADTADELVRDAAMRGVDLDERLRLALHLAERLTAPRTVAVLSTLLDRVDAIERLLAAADAAPGFVAMAVDTADDLVRDAQAAGLDVVAGRVGGALAAAVAGEPPRVGPLGLLRALRDPDVQRSLGLLLRVAAALGRALERPAGHGTPASR